MRNIHILPNETLNHFLSITDMAVKDPQKFDYKNTVLPKEFLKQETLEEAAKDYIENTMRFSFNSMETKTQANRMLKCVEFGAKWQQERSYSEEDVRKAIQLARLCTLDSNTGEFIDLSGLTEVCTYGLEETYSENLIIEQFKKK